MLESEKSTATSSPQKNFICPNCNRPFISARSVSSHKKVHRTRDQSKSRFMMPTARSLLPRRRQKNAPRHGRYVPRRNGHPKNYHPYARPNDHVVSKGGDERPPAKTLDFVGKCQTLNPTVPAGGPTEAVKSYERMMTNPINAGEEVSSKKEDVDLELKPLVLK